MSVIDLTDTIVAKSDQLNAADIAGKKIITVTKATKKKGGEEQPISINYEGDNGKPWKPCLSMRRVIAYMWGSKVDMTGRQIELFNDPTVTWGGLEVGGIRISAMSHISSKKTMPLRISQKKVIKFTVEVLEIKEAPAELDSEDLKRQAGVSADGGMDTYKEFFEALSKAEKEILKSDHAKFKKQAEAADAEKESTDVEVEEEVADEPAM